MSGTVADQDDQAAHPRKADAALLLGALGIVYGDIGTSPIYTLRESFKAAGIAAAPDPATAQAAVLGVLSMVKAVSAARCLDPVRARDRTRHPGRALSRTASSRTMA